MIDLSQVPKCEAPGAPALEGERSVWHPGHPPLNPWSQKRDQGHPQLAGDRCSRSRRQVAVEGGAGADFAGLHAGGEPLLALGA